MKPKSIRYLSHRASVLMAAFAVLSASLVMAAGWIALSAGENIWMPALGFLLWLALLYAGYRFVLQPYKESSKLLQLFATGYTVSGVMDMRYPVSPEVEKALQKLELFLSTHELLNATKRQAQYLALQNQINPHFLYNTLEGIRGEALVAGLDTVAEMTEALATFFRYTISNMDNLATLEDELTNIENYYIIQQYRFGQRLQLHIVCEDEDRQRILQCRLPKLTLQPIVENAIYHGIERKVGNGEVIIRIEATSTRLIITVSDTGMGMEPHRLQALIQSLNTPSYEYVTTENQQQGGIALVNVKNRIKLLFGEEYGVTIYSTVNIGTDVEITLPLITKEVKSNP